MKYIPRIASNRRYDGSASGHDDRIESHGGTYMIKRALQTAAILAAAALLTACRGGLGNLFDIY
jgi:hypothetical protein